MPPVPQGQWGQAAAATEPPGCLSKAEHPPEALPDLGSYPNMVFSNTEKKKSEIAMNENIGYV